ncbi:hypothetical protein [Spirosoma pomorum]
MIKLTPEQKKQLSDWVDNRAKRNYTRAQWDESYQQWHRGGRGWKTCGEGGTGIMIILCWYHHQFKPGSKEWRPKIILTALLKEIQKENAEPVAAVEYIPTAEHLNDLQRDHDARNGRPQRPATKVLSPAEFGQALRDIMNAPTANRLS